MRKRAGLMVAATATVAALLGLAPVGAATAPTTAEAPDLVSGRLPADFDGRLFPDPETGCIQVYRAPDEDPAFRPVPELSAELLRRPWPRCDGPLLLPGKGPATPSER